MISSPGDDRVLRGTAAEHNAMEGWPRRAPVVADKGREKRSMRLCTYQRGDVIGVGVEQEGEVYATPYGDMLSLIHDGDAGLERIRGATDAAKAKEVDRYLAPIPWP